MQSAIQIHLKIVLLCSLLYVEVRVLSARKIYFLELMNTSTAAERTAIEKVVDDINSQLVFDGSSFTLQIRNASQQVDFYSYASSLVGSDAIALIDFNTSPYEACAAETVSKIPVIRLHGMETYKTNEVCEQAIVMSADYKSYTHAAIEILDSFQWKKVALMFERSRFYEAAYFQFITAKKDYILSCIQLLSQHNNSLSDIAEKATSRLVALDVDVVLLYAGEYSILEKEGCNPNKSYVWIIQESVPLNITAHPSHMVVGFGLPRNRSETNKKNESELLAYDAVLLVATTLKHIHKNGSWMLGNGSVNSSDRATFYRLAKQMKIKGLTSSVRFDADGVRVVDELRILNLINNSFSQMGRWRKTGRYRLHLDERIRRNFELASHPKLQGRKISVVVVLTKPFVMKRIAPDSTVTYHGFCIDLLNKLASDLKFTYEIHEVEDGLYGTLFNGEWNGMIRELIDGKAEMIVAPLERNTERQKYVAMTSSFMFFTEKLLMKRKFIEQKDFLQFMSPFSASVWWILLLWLVVITFALYILNYLSPYGHKNDQGVKIYEEFNLFNCLWFSIACMLQQGADNTPRAASGRILVGFFWFSILVWFATYTANLVAFFTVQSFYLPVANLEEAISSSYDIGVKYKSNLHARFNVTEYDLHRRAWNRMKRLPKNDSEAVEWVRKHQYIHIDDGAILDYIANKLPCDLVTVPGLQSIQSNVFALRQNDPHVQEISFAILHLRDNGFIEKLRQKYWDNTNECRAMHSKKITNKTIQLDSMAGVFIVLAVGFLISLLTLAIEIYWYRAGKQRIKSLKEKFSSKTSNGEERSDHSRYIEKANEREELTERNDGQSQINPGFVSINDWVSYTTPEGEEGGV